MAEGIEGLGRLASRLGQLATDTRHVEKPLGEAGEYLIGSVKKTFYAQGRPQKWTPLAPSTLRSRRKGKGRGGPKILMDTLRMMNALDKRVTPAGVAVGLNAAQARRQHFGYPGGTGRGHSRTPARPFLMLQDPEDVTAIGKIFSRHIARK
jgi:phage gpG-like protein